MASTPPHQATARQEQQAEDNHTKPVDKWLAAALVRGSIAEFHRAVAIITGGARR